MAALDDEGFVVKCRNENWAGLKQLEVGFEAQGREFVPSKGNFILVKVGEGARVFEALQRQGVIVRPMKPYGLAEWLRVTVGTAEQNTRLLAILPAAIAGD